MTVKMTALPVATIVLVAGDGTMTLITLVSSIVVAAAALVFSTARLRRVVASTTSIVVVTRLLLAVLLVLVIVSLVLDLVLSQFLILEFHAPVKMEVITELGRVKKMVRIKRINFLIVSQPILHFLK